MSRAADGIRTFTARHGRAVLLFAALVLLAAAFRAIDDGGLPPRRLEWTWAADGAFDPGRAAAARWTAAADVADPPGRRARGELWIRVTAPAVADPDGALWFRAVAPLEVWAGSNRLYTRGTLGSLEFQQRWHLVPTGPLAEGAVLVVRLAPRDPAGSGIVEARFGPAAALAVGVVRRGAPQLVLGILFLGAGVALAGLAAAGRARRALAPLAAFCLAVAVVVVALADVKLLIVDDPLPWHVLTATLPLVLLLLLGAHVAVAYRSGRALAPLAWVGAALAAGMGVTALVPEFRFAAHVEGEAASFLFILVFVVYLFTLVRGAPAFRDDRAISTGFLVMALCVAWDMLQLLAYHVQMASPPDTSALLSVWGFFAFVMALGVAALAAGAREARELGVARGIQSALLPRRDPAVPGLDVAARYRPMAEVGGDYYGYLDAGDGRLGVLVADVSGHGVPAALIASMVRVALVAERDRAAEPDAVLAGINRTLVGGVEKQFVTAQYAWIDPVAGRVALASGGHPALVLRRAGAVAGEYRPRGRVLGVWDDAPFTREEFSIGRGDRLLFCTDGLLEARNGEGVPFEDGAFAAAFAALDGVPAGACADGLLAALEGHVGGASFDDDVTLVVVDVA